jgi:hypothetical protein
LGLAIVLVGAAIWWVPFLARSRAVVTSTPSPGPSYSRLDVPLKAGSQACVDNVALDPRSAQVQVIASTRAPAATPLEFEARAPGYRQSRTVTASTAGKPVPVRAALAPPARTVTGVVCVRNRSGQAVALYGTNEATAIGLSRTSVDGRSLGGAQGISLTLLEARDRSILARLGTVVQRASAFSGALMPPWILWPLVVLLVVAAPPAIFWAFWLALREEVG